MWCEIETDATICSAWNGDPSGLWYWLTDTFPGWGERRTTTISYSTTGIATYRYVQSTGEDVIYIYFFLIP